MHYIKWAGLEDSHEIFFFKGKMIGLEWSKKDRVCIGFLKDSSTQTEQIMYIQNKMVSVALFLKHFLKLSH